MNAVAESIFGTQQDPDQIPITHESAEKLDTLTPDWWTYKLDENGEPISWIILIPTTKELAKKFLAKEITERQLFEMTQPQEKYSAVYLCSAITVPEHRRKGLAMQLTKEGLDKIPKTDDCLLFSDPFSTEGAAVLEKAKSLGVHIEIRK